MEKLTVKAKRDRIPLVSSFWEETAETMGVSPKAQMQLNVVLDELLVNIVNYAYPSAEGDVTLQVEDEGEFVRLTLIDCGVPFNPLDRPDPDVSLSAEEREIGGLGIFLSKKMTDGMEYRFEDGCNILSVWKKKQSERRRNPTL